MGRVEVCSSLTARVARATPCAGIFTTADAVVVTNGPTEPNSFSEADELDAMGQATIALKFDRDSPSSIEAAIRELDARIDMLVAPFSSNAFIEEIAWQIKSECCDSLLWHIADVRFKCSAPLTALTRPTIYFPANTS